MAYCKSEQNFVVVVELNISERDYFAAELSECCNYFLNYYLNSDNQVYSAVANSDLNNCCKNYFVAAADIADCSNCCKNCSQSFRKKNLIDNLR